MSVAARILHFGRTRAHAAAIAEGGRIISFGELARFIRRTASHMAALGWRRGDRIGICLGDSSDHLIALLAAAHLGAVAVPLDWRARPAENARFAAALGLRCCLLEADAPDAGDTPAIRLDAEWQRQVALADPEPHGTVDWNDPFVISASSGSTGAPKFTLMTNLQYFFAIAGMWELMNLGGPHRFLCTLPLYYSGGRNSCMAHLLRGDCVVLYSSLFAAEEYVDVVRRERITAAALVPSMVRQLLAAAGDVPLLPELAALFCTGAPLHAEEKLRAARSLTPRFHERYGTAETLALSVLRPEHFAERADSVGQPHSLIEVQIVDEDDRPLAEGDVGRMRLRGPGVGLPLPGIAETGNFRGGWYFPGEIARLDEAKFIFLQGRTSDVIMRSGAKIFPSEIEAVLLGHPAVIEAAVIGLPGPDHQEIVAAFVVRRTTVPAGELIAHCRGRLSAHKVPRQFYFLANLPRNTGGKIDKPALIKSLTADAEIPRR